MDCTKNILFQLLLLLNQVSIAQQHFQEKYCTYISIDKGYKLQIIGINLKFYQLNLSKLDSVKGTPINVLFFSLYACVFCCHYICVFVVYTSYTNKPFLHNFF